MPANLLIENIDFLVTANQEQRILCGAWLQIEDGFIRGFGTDSAPSVPQDYPRLSGRGKIATPGLVNTHHHLYQNMARAYTPGNNQSLLPWLANMNKLWEYFREDDLYICTKLGIAELMLSGATTIADHHYVFPRDAKNMTETQFEASDQMGVRFHASRGSMNFKSDLISDWALQDEDTILADTEALITKHHVSEPGSYQQVIVAPCAATSCSKSLLIASAQLAKLYDVGLHTHCGETLAENEYSVEKFGARPLEYLLDCGWDYDNAWLAHGIHFDDEELATLAKHGIGVAHCPNANMRLGSGICRVPELIDHAIKVGIAVDGSASNDSGHLLGELRQAFYLARVKYGAEAMSALDAIDLGTWRSANLMGRDDIGKIEIGKCGDIALFPFEDLYSNGAENPVDALLICHPRQVSDLVIGGNIRVREQQIIGLDLPALRNEHRMRAKKVRETSFH
ncbi:amidohydrolase family protein [Puniceicoccaceae bacterium K14]|nr:amidohydrolase family protein [Puniceicoccaceae bacterium K14]